MSKVPPEPDDSAHSGRCVVYAAKSTQDRRGSIPAQMDDCRAMAAREGWLIVGEYHDEGFSAYKGNRGPGLAAAREHAAREASASGCVVFLLVLHSDRISRGAGDRPGAAEALIEIWHVERRRNVHLRSVQDDFDLRTSASVANIGERNRADSERKGAGARDGLRRAAHEGRWVGGILPDGYRVIRQVDDHGRVVCNVETDPDRVEIFRFIWDSAVTGWSVESIVLELDRRAVMTNPRKPGHPRPFDRNRVCQTLNNPFYAGLSVYRKEIVGKGHWPAYVTPELFEQAAADRLARAGRERGPGRPRREESEYLLSGLARCGACGRPMSGVTSRGTKNQRRDGSFPRRYVCEAHGREYPRGHSLYCDVKPIDATVVDQAFAANLEQFLGDVGGWRDQLTTTRAAEHARITAEATRARAEVNECERVANRLRTRYDELVASGEDPKAEIVLETLANRRGESRRAATRLAATLDALAAVSQDVPVDPLIDFYNRLGDELTGRVAAATGDVRRTNVILREFLASVELTVTDEGVRMLPVLSSEAAARILQDPDLWPHGVDAAVLHGSGEPTDFAPFAADGRIGQASFSVADPSKLPNVGDEVTVAFRVHTPDAVIASPRATPPLRTLTAGNPRSPWWMRVSGGRLLLPAFDTPRNDEGRAGTRPTPPVQGSNVRTKEIAQG